MRTNRSSWSCASCGWALCWWPNPLRTLSCSTGSRIWIGWANVSRASGKKARPARRRYFEYRIASSVPLTQAGTVCLNFVEVWERNKQGKVIYHNSWVTDFEVRRENAATIIGIGRSRWKIENEQFNVQKNHGYELEHNYGHGHQTLSMVFYLLNLLAFLAHQVLEYGDRLYQQCRAGESRRGLWNLLRAVFCYVAVESWEALLLYHLSDETR